MTLFQMVTVENPIKLTPKARNLWPEIQKTLAKADLVQLFKDTVEGLEIGLSLAKEQENNYFVEMCQRDLDS